MKIITVRKPLTVFRRWWWRRWTVIPLTVLRLIRLPTLPTKLLLNLRRRLFLSLLSLKTLIDGRRSLRRRSHFQRLRTRLVLFFVWCVTVLIVLFKKPLILLFGKNSRGVSGRVKSKFLTLLMFLKKRKISPTRKLSRLNVFMILTKLFSPSMAGQRSRSEIEKFRKFIRRKLRFRDSLRRVSKLLRLILLKLRSSGWVPWLTVRRNWSGKSRRNRKVILMTVRPVKMKLLRLLLFLPVVFALGRMILDDFRAFPRPRG